MENEEAQQREQLWAKLASLMPSFLWFALAAIVVWKAYDPLLELVRQGALRKIGVGTFQIEFAEVLIRRVRGLDKQGISESDQKILLDRFSRLSDRLQRRSILWVDNDHPQQNASLRPLLSSLGVNIDLASSTNEAWKWLSQADYEVVITDLDRPHDESAPCYSSPEPANAGCALLKAVGGQRRGAWPKLVVYAARINPALGTPPYAEGATNQPGQLLHLILDAVSRMKT